MLINDHDPKPLRYQFEAQYPGEFTWDYLQTGPKAWRVRIGRAAAWSLCTANSGSQAASLLPPTSR